MGEIDELGARLRDLEKTVQQFQVYFKVLAALAVVFGVSGGWGIKILTDSEDRLSVLDKDIATYEKWAIDIREEREQELREFARTLKSEIANSADRFMQRDGMSLAVVSFDAETCPQGWRLYEKAFGRFVRGIDPTGSEDVDPDGHRSPGDPQGDAVGTHQHPLPREVWGLSGSGSNPAAVDGGGGAGVVATEDYQSPETRPKNVALLYCIWGG